MLGIFTFLSSLFKYIFITIIYLFIFGIIRMIIFDIKKMDAPRPREIPKDMPYLQLLTDKSTLYFDVKSVYPLDKEIVIIGRGAQCDIPIDDLYMSTQHVQLWHEDNEWYIADLGSTNGTYINGTRMSDDPLILDNGDQLKIGQLELLVVI